ncbi:MAG: HD domain-containing protein [Myxococcota bacterium]
MDDLATLHQRIDDDPALRTLRDELERRWTEDPAGPDPGHDLAHALRVAHWTLLLAPEVDPRWCIAAALLHDAVNVPKDSPERASASSLSADLARALLPTAGFASAATEEVAVAIRDHSYSRGATPTSDLGKALQDADRLEALGALGLCRTFSCGARMGAAYFDPDDPWAQGRDLDDRRYTVDHFFTKLLTLPKTMNTEGGRQEAERRAEFLRSFLQQLAVEIGQPQR